MMIPHHTKPICGEDSVLETLTCYRDAIQFTHDQTVRYMNKGKIEFRWENYVKLFKKIIVELQ